MMIEMKERIKKTFFLLPFIVPVVFSLVFFGYFRMNYDIVLHTDNIKGEGICQTFLCPYQGIAAFYRVEFYFGSELKKATIEGYHCDVDQIHFMTSEVSEFDITGVDSYLHGIHLSHLDPDDILPSGEQVNSPKATLISQNGALHVVVNDPNVGATVSIKHPFIPLWFWSVYYMAILLISVILAFIMSYVFDKIPVLRFPVVSVSCITITLLAGCFFCGSLPFVTYINFLLNWLFLFAAALLINGLTLPWLGTVLTMAFTTVWYIANYFVIAFRSKPIMPADLKAAGTAAEVMGGYQLVPSWQMILGVVVVIVYAVLAVLVWWKDRPEERQPLRHNLMIRGIMVTAAILLMVIGINTSTFKNLDSFAWDGVLLTSFHEEGMVLTFLKSAYNSGVDKPEGYSREAVDEYLKEYEQSSSAEKYAVQPVNVIMVMNEAFSDLRTVGLNEKIDVMPFIDSLENNTVEGALGVSVFGGGTCNTEFEALTGNTLAFLGAGAYPYTEDVTKPMFSLAEYFNDIGYTTEAFHANDPDNWNRSMVYPNFGFETFNSIEDFKKFKEIEFLHEQPADISDYEYIESESDKYKGGRRFLFDVTMQNHSPYDRWLDVKKADSVEENGSDLYVDTQIYLSLIKASDDEIRQLVETYKDSDEPTMIIFFGDHQPGLPTTAIEQIYTDIEYNLDLYKSKFFIWTNYKTESEHDTYISANYMPWLILERGNFALPPYVQMLKEVHDKYPVISSQGVMDSDGNVYSGVAELSEDPLIKKYQYIQYANMYDEISDEWFETD